MVCLSLDSVAALPLTLTRLDSMSSDSHMLSLMLPALAASVPAVYIDEATGSDTQGDGSTAAPYATALGAFTARDTQDLSLFVRKPAPQDALPGAGPEWQPISPTALKKAKKLHDTNKKKLAKKAEAEKKTDGDSEEKKRLDAEKLEQSKSIVLDEPNEPSDRIKINQAVNKRDRRVRVFGWVHRLRQQGGLIFIVLRDGSGYLQCVLSGKLVRLLVARSRRRLANTATQAQTFDALTLTLESTIQITGTIKALPPGKKAPDNHELSADWWAVVGKAPGGDDAISNMVSGVRSLAQYYPSPSRLDH
jgi:asparaginyl-tRNA synthetase